MAMFVHLTPEKYVKAIKRAGIKAQYAREGFPKGVFAMPVVPDFYVSHQWLRELKRGGQRTIWGVYFRIPDEEEVWVGHYYRSQVLVAACEAVEIIMKQDETEGYQVFVPRKIEKGEIHKIRALPQVVGWRYYPGAHGRKPCGCPVCLRRGEIKSSKIRKAWQLQFE